ncbi:allophanate hydrolase-related protein [Arenibaculum pallidiluteum]|uniref:allophanate hydrolase-related protein n=1 Tax=Arenibaculum pallidiluteum TaxID=2812559 RepID=UPI0038B2A1B4
MTDSCATRRRSAPGRTPGDQRARRPRTARRGRIAAQPALGARLAGPVRTAPVYRLYCLPGEPPCPGLVRVREGGAAIDAEVWEIPSAGVAAFLARIPFPLAFGSVELAGGGRRGRGGHLGPWGLAQLRGQPRALSPCRRRSSRTGHRAPLTVRIAGRTHLPDR